MQKQPVDLDAFYAKEDPVQDQIDDLVAAIVKCRKSGRITQMELSESTGIPQSTISRLESFRTVPTLQVLIQLANALNLELRLMPSGGKNEHSDS